MQLSGLFSMENEITGISKENKQDYLIAIYYLKAWVGISI